VCYLIKERGTVAFEIFPDCVTSPGRPWYVVVTYGKVSNAKVPVCLSERTQKAHFVMSY